MERSFLVLGQALGATVLITTGYYMRHHYVVSSGQWRREHVSVEAEFD